jgi:hypothetical protein
MEGGIQALWDAINDTQKQARELERRCAAAQQGTISGQDELTNLSRQMLADGEAARTLDVTNTRLQHQLQQLEADGRPLAAELEAASRDRWGLGLADWEPPSPQLRLRHSTPACLQVLRRCWVPGFCPCVMLCDVDGLGQTRTTRYQASPARKLHVLCLTCACVLPLLAQAEEELQGVRAQVLALTQQVVVQEKERVRLTEEVKGLRHDEAVSSGNRAGTIALAHGGGGKYRQPHVSRAIFILHTSAAPSDSVVGCVATMCGHRFSRDGAPTFVTGMCTATCCLQACKARHRRLIKELDGKLSAARKAKVGGTTGGK